MEIVESKFLAGVSDVVDSAGESSNFAGKLLSWGDLTLHAILLDICGDRDRRVKLVGIWLGILGLPKLLDMSGSEFVVLLDSRAGRVSTNFERMIESRYPRA